MNAESLHELMSRWQRGDVDWNTIEEGLRTAYASMAPTSDALVDLDRERRCGHPEVVFGPGKSPQAIVAVFEAQLAARQNSLATRVTAEQAELVCRTFPDAQWNAVGRTLTLTRSPVEARGLVLVVTAGTSDRPVAEEALETARWMGCQTELMIDVGVAGPQRLLAQRDRLAQADAIVVVAGMEGALPSVVAGWVSVPVIGVPTSVGYGANFGGFAALLSMLNSCAANVAVVNIDAGFKGGYLAGLVARQSALNSTFEVD
jgi:pyridinium-3,5-biscarboxylic acid mononucleotide synthase